MACDLSERCHWHTTNRFRYLYPEPVTRVQTCLRLLPRVRHGAQQVVRSHLVINPQPRAARSWTDDFGNCVLEVEHPRLSSHLEVIAECCFNVAEEGPEPEVPEPLLGPAEVRGLFLPPTRLVDRTREFELLAMELRRGCDTEEALAWETMNRVFQEMRYLSGSTTVATAASDAYGQRTGVCQDFAHVMLALCRAAGLPARYVSGHMQGEGQMHAWVETFYAPAAGDPPAWHALDPTHNRAAAGAYVTIAVGRDFADVSPISGRCYGPVPGHLSSHQETRCFLKEILPLCE
jgi:transglutaminase-like putative cysteine protease